MVHYRKLRRDEDQFPNLTLSEALVQALEHRHADGSRIKDNWRHRVAQVPNIIDHYRFLNDSHHDGEILFGNTCLFSPNQLQPLIERDPDASVLDISEMRAPDGTEYLHAISYWLAIRDHFFIVQHVALQSKAMEEYLTWLLRDQTQIIGDNHYVQLQAIFDRNQVGDDFGDIKSVEVGGLVPDTVRAPPPAEQLGAEVVEVDARQALGERMAQTFEKAREILETIIGPMATQEIIEKMPEEAALEVNVNFGYRSKKRRFNKEFMSALEASLRNMPDGEVRVRSNMGIITGEDARLQTVMPIKLVRENSSLLDMEDALGKLKEVYRRFLEDGRIIN